MSKRQTEFVKAADGAFDGKAEHLTQLFNLAHLGECLVVLLSMPPLTAAVAADGSAAVASPRQKRQIAEKVDDSSTPPEMRVLYAGL